MQPNEFATNFKIKTFVFHSFWNKTSVPKDLKHLSQTHAAPWREGLERARTKHASNPREIIKRML